ncbi:MAG: hypothetical protein AABZ06_03065 [Bdellovibrionota bacterium]
MRKIIALTSTTLAIVFAIALASAEDASTQPADTSQSTSAPDMSQTMPDTSRDTSKAATEDLKNAKTCMDDHGVIHNRGTKQFQKCIDNKRRMMEQMGGQAGTDETKSENNTTSTY